MKLTRKITPCLFAGLLLLTPGITAHAERGEADVAAIVASLGTTIYANTFMADAHIAGMADALSSAEYDRELVNVGSGWLLHRYTLTKLTLGQKILLGLNLIKLAGQRFTIVYTDGSKATVVLLNCQASTCAAKTIEILPAIAQNTPAPDRGAKEPTHGELGDPTIICRARYKMVTYTVDIVPSTSGSGTLNPDSTAVREKLVFDGLECV
ncbi:hypothetical protein [Chitinimonas sp. JJ19]|uniref:hypothetical protein n=1 Tax=Chitinimonas sp. JJ19 TaxID=3109352 RepID=UPI001A5F5DC0|nr:hypothetical protein [Chitinimonas sp.]